MRAIGQPVRSKPTVLSEGEAAFRLELIREELDELEEALYEGNLTKTADALADLEYVLMGTASLSGIDMMPVFNEVHRSNMTKIGGPKRADGKQLKPDMYSPPNIESIIQCQLAMAGYKNESHPGCIVCVKEGDLNGKSNKQDTNQNRM